MDLFEECVGSILKHVTIFSLRGTQTGSKELKADPGRMTSNVLGCTLGQEHRKREVRGKRESLGVKGDMAAGE